MRDAGQIVTGGKPHYIHCHLELFLAHHDTIKRTAGYGLGYLSNFFIQFFHGHHPVNQAELMGFLGGQRFPQKHHLLYPAPPDHEHVQGNRAFYA